MFHIGPAAARTRWCKLAGRPSTPQDLLIGEVLAVRHDDELPAARGRVDVARLLPSAHVEGEYRSHKEKVGEHGLSTPLAGQCTQPVRRGSAPGKETFGKASPES